MAGNAHVEPNWNLMYSEGDHSLLTIVLIIAGFISCCVLGFLNPVAAFASMVLLVISIVGLRFTEPIVLTLCALIPFDLQVQLANGKAVYLDFAVALLVLPVLLGVFMSLRDHRRVLFLFVPYLAFSFASSFWRAENRFWFWAFTLRILISFCFALAVYRLRSIRPVIYALAGSLVPLVLYGIYQLVIGELGTLYILMNPKWRSSPWMDRAYGFLPHPNAFGDYCAIVTVMLFAFCLRTNRVTARTLCFIASFVGMIGMLASGSRGAWLGAAAGFLLIIFVGSKSMWARVGVMISCGTMVAVATLLDFMPLARAQGIEEFIKDTRMQLYAAAVFFFLQHPFIGIGTSNFPEMMPRFIDWQYDVVHAHNSYLHVLSENGLIGVALLYVPLLYLGVMNLRRAKTNSVSLIAAAALLVIAVHGMFDVMFYNPQNLSLMAVVVGIAARALRTNAAVEDVI